MVRSHRAHADSEGRDLRADPHLIEFETLDEAIAWHNDVPQGLSSAIFTDESDGRRRHS